MDDQGLRSVPTTPPSRRAAGSRTPARPPVDTAEPAWKAVRSSVTLLVLIVLIGGYAYPMVATEVAQTLTPATAGGSLLQSPNGTYYGSTLLGQNVTSPCLFWLRPSIIDYQAFTGAGSEVPYGPTDPHLLNITTYYAHLYGLTNVSAPVDLFSASASGLDPAITPEAAFVQVPRVAQNTSLTEAWLTGFVQAHVNAELLGFIGPEYVNVLELDLDLESHLPSAGLGGGCGVG
ncbi:MAG: potassium-transporting ATPase subunit C [Thermoplasmata archaeon]|nr:potassium-transporting ATPase subunit C [Thermoplasmata archaeon]